MELGKTIVSELGLDPGVDTLGRWMAHHIAELITDAESAPDPEAKRTKEAQAVEAISRLWQHRSAYDNRINPLHELQPVLQVLRTLDPNRNVWITNFSGPDGNAFAQVYDALRRLVILMVVRKSGLIISVVSTTTAHQNSDEKEIIATFNEWLSDTQRAAVESTSKTKNRSKKKATEPKKARKEDANDEDPDKLPKELIAHAREALDKLSAELLGLPKSQDPDSLL